MGGGAVLRKPEVENELTFTNLIDILKVFWQPALRSVVLWAAAVFLLVLFGLSYEIKHTIFYLALCFTNEYSGDRLLVIITQQRPPFLILVKPQILATTAINIDNVFTSPSHKKPPTYI